MVRSKNVSLKLLTCFPKGEVAGGGDFVRSTKFDVAPRPPLPALEEEEAGCWLLLVLLPPNFLAQISRTDSLTFSDELLEGRPLEAPEIENLSFQL